MTPVLSPREYFSLCSQMWIRCCTSGTEHWYHSQLITNSVTCYPFSLSLTHSLSLSILSLPLPVSLLGSLLLSLWQQH